MSLVEKVRSAKEKLGINIGIGAYNKSRKKKEKEKGSRDVKNKRGRTTGKEYWNASTGKWQSTPVKRGRNLPGGSHHKGGEIGRKSDKPSEGNFRKQFPQNKSKSTGDSGGEKTLAPNTKAKDANGDRKTNKDLAITKSNVFTKHYKTGKALGVMTRNQRRAYDKAAAEHKKKQTDKKATETKKPTPKKDNKKSNYGLRPVNDKKYNKKNGK